MIFLESITSHRNAGKALLAANFYNAETLLAVLYAAKETNSEVILQTSPSTLDYLGVGLAVSMVRSASQEHGVVAWLHLDHATNLELIHQCIRAGYDSVMIDASEHDFDTNIKLTRQSVTAAHQVGIAVEAELGYVPKLGQKDVQEAGLTVPEEAKKFVEETGIDLLAVAIGTAHGFYKKKPNLDLDRLAAIRKLVKVPLVLHGGSGLTPEQWQETIKRGVAKINFATEIKDTFIRAIKQSMLKTEEIDLRKIFPAGIKAATQLVAAKMQVCKMV